MSREECFWPLNPLNDSLRRMEPRDIPSFCSLPHFTLRMIAAEFFSVFFPERVLVDSAGKHGMF